MHRRRREHLDCDRAIESDITPETEGTPSNQVCEPADSSITVGVLVEYEGMEASPYCLLMDSLNVCGESNSLCPLISSEPDSSSLLSTPLSLPRPPPLQTALMDLIFFIISHSYHPIIATSHQSLSFTSSFIDAWMSETRGSASNF